MFNHNFVHLISSYTDEDSRWMKVAINYGLRNVGFTGKNPCVGCVIVKNNELCGFGTTSPGGRPHAEENALKFAGEKSKGAVLYVTLEPCAHYERFIPCMEKIVQASIKRVVIACLDPDKRTNGKAVKYLLEKNISVSLGCEEFKAMELIQGFTKRLNFKRPYIKSKIASSLDSKISLSNGISKWITGTNARKFIHLYRLRSDGILTGVNTVNDDNPTLNCRIKGLKKYSPHVFILDSKLKINIKSKILNRKNISIFTTVFLNKKKEKILKNKGINVILVKHNKNNQVLLKEVIKKLYEQKINNLFIEAGSDINSSLIKENLIDEIILCRSGRIFGNDGRSIVNNLNIKEIKHSNKFYFKDSFTLDEDIIENWVFKA